MLWNKEQLCGSFWQSVKWHDFYPQEIEGGGWGFKMCPLPSCLLELQELRLKITLAIKWDFSVSILRFGVLKAVILSTAQMPGHLIAFLVLSISGRRHLKVWWSCVLPWPGLRKIIQIKAAQFVWKVGKEPCLLVGLNSVFKIIKICNNCCLNNTTSAAKVRAAITTLKSTTTALDWRH